MSEVNKLIEAVAKDIFKYNTISTQDLKDMLNSLRQTQFNQQGLRYQEMLNQRVDVQNLQAPQYNQWRVTNE